MWIIPNINPDVKFGPQREQKAVNKLVMCLTTASRETTEVYSRLYIYGQNYLNLHDPKLSMIISWNYVY